MNIFDFLAVFGQAESMGGDASGGDGGGEAGDQGAVGAGSQEDSRNLPVMPSWAAGLPAEITATEAARNILLQHKDDGQNIEVPIKLVGSYIEAKRERSGMVTIPGDNATLEQKTAFNKKMGVPDKPDGYEFKVPDGSPDGMFDDTAMTAFKTDAHELGVPKAKAEELFTRFSGRQVEAYNGAMTGNQQTVQERVDGLKKELGTEFDATVKTADKTLHFADPAMMEVFEKAGLIGHPVLVKGFAKLGTSLGEGLLKGAGTTTPSSTMTKQEVEVMMKDPRYNLPEGDPVGIAWRAKVTAGFQALYPGSGGADIGPSSGRAMHGAA